MLLDGLDQPHGLAFDGSTLYVAESDQIDAFDYADGTATHRGSSRPACPTPAAPTCGGAYAHALKSVAVAPDGAVYFSIGSTGNISAADRTANPPRATIMRIPPGGGPADAVRHRGAQRHRSGGRPGRFGVDGGQQSRQRRRSAPRSVLRQGHRLRQRPSAGDHRPADTRTRIGLALLQSRGGRHLRFIRDVQTNADGSELDCAALPPVEQTLGAHSAPLGLSFADGVLPAPFTRGALSAVHGSWNRQPPRAPEVSFFAWRNGTLGRSRPWSADSRTRTARGGGGRWPRWPAPTARCTSPTITPTRCTGSRRRGVDR